MLLRAPHLALLVVLCGCARKPMLRPSAQEDSSHDVIYRGGQLFVVSRAPRSSVVLEPVAGATGRYQVEKRVSYVLVISNLGEERVEVSEENVTALANDKATHVFRATEIEDQIHDDSRWEQALNSISGTLQSIGAQSRLERLVVAENTARRAGAIKSGEQTLADHLASWALQRTTLGPGESVIGGVSVDAPRKDACPRYVSTNSQDDWWREPGPCRWRILVRVGAETHTFEVNESME
jgi:hypothetical protein